jgi:hypothetical protein
MFTDLLKTQQEFFKLTADYFIKFPKTESEFKDIFFKIQSVFQTEMKNTKEMWQIYQKSATGDATANDIAKANKKAQELLKTTSFAFLVSMPGTIFVLPAIIEMAKKYDIDLIPASVSTEFTI